MVPLGVADFGPPEIFKLTIGAVVVAEVIGVPAAWLRLRRTVEWANRPTDVRRMELLSRYVRRITGFAAAWALLVALSAFTVAALS
jgi:hypothetical protein